MEAFAQLQRVIRTLGFNEVARHCTATDFCRLGGEAFISAIETQLKMLSPWLVASAITLPSTEFDQSKILGISLNFHELLLAASLIQLLQRYLPELRRIIRFGISERIAEQQAMAVLERGLELATQANAGAPSGLITQVNKQLCSADLHPHLLLAAITEQIYPALFDMLGGLLYSSLYFTRPTTLVLVGYMCLNVLVNYAIMHFCDLAQHKNQLMHLQNAYHTRSYGVLNKAVTIELHQRRSLELGYLHNAYTAYRQLKQKITHLERAPALQYLCVLVTQLTALILLYLHHLATLPTEQTVFLFIYLSSLSAQFASLSSGWRSAAASMHALAELRVFLNADDRPATALPLSSTAPELYQPLLHADEEQTHSPSAHALALQLNHVSFWYEPSRPVLQDITLEIPTGSHCALVGSSQCGKSTLTRLMLGLLTPSNHSDLSVFGTSAALLTKQERYQRVYLVTQEADEGLFEDKSVAYNILYAHCSDAILIQLKDDSTCLQTPEQAMLHQYYLQLCEQAKITHVAFRNHCQGLSGGEKQRIKIARALASQAPFIILDEATSQLDARTEAEVLQHITTCLKGRTLLFISHQLRTIRHCNPIYVMKASPKGSKIIEHGTHASLIKADGEYAALWQLQHTN